MSVRNGDPVLFLFCFNYTHNALTESQIYPLVTKNNNNNKNLNFQVYIRGSPISPAND